MVGGSAGKAQRSDTMRAVRSALLVGIAAAFAAQAPAAAQTAKAGAPAFRVPLKDGVTDPGVPPVYTWLETVSACSTTCGTGTRTTTYQCQTVSAYDWQNGGYGVPEPSSACTSAIGPAPADKTESCVNYSSCSYDWVAPSVSKTATPPGRVGCGQVRSQFDPYCRRSDGVVLAQGDHALCSADRPDYDGVAAGNPDALGFDRTAVETSACNASDHQWKVGAWGPPSSTCSTTATSVRSVVCERKFDNAIVADAECGVGKPETSKTEPVYSSCSYSWKTSEWSAYSSTCSTSATRTRSVTCERSNGDAVEDAQCGSAGAKPAASETSPQYGSCTYSATNWGSPTFSSTCASNATKTETAQCLRSDGTIVASADCAGAGVSLTRTSTEANYTSCSYDWVPGAWSAPSSTCSANATQTRSVTCQRSNGDAVGDVQCNPGTRPASTQGAPTYSSCGYSAGGTPSYGAWASNCSNSTTRNRHMQCVRSNDGGQIVADSECTSRGVALDFTDTGSNLSGCGYAWQTGGWSAPSNTCGAGSQSRAVYCQRSDGTVADSSCPSGTRPAATHGSTDYSSCGYSMGGITSYGAWSSTCSASATRSENHSCTRSDGTTVANTECTSRGVNLTTTSAATAVYDGCGYQWQAGAWGASSSTCSASATQARSVWCRRSDGSTVGDGQCDAGSRPPASQTVADYSGCSYTPTYGSYSACSGGTQSASMTGCTRSDGSGVATSYCTGTGHAAAVSRSCTVPVGANCRLVYSGGSCTGAVNVNGPYTAGFTYGTGGWYPNVIEGYHSALVSGNATPSQVAASRNGMCVDGYGGAGQDDAGNNTTQHYGSGVGNGSNGSPVVMVCDQVQ